MFWSTSQLENVDETESVLKSATDEVMKAIEERGMLGMVPKLTFARGEK